METAQRETYLTRRAAYAAAHPEGARIQMSATLTNTCPCCGTVSPLMMGFQRNTQRFCGRCDFPLFQKFASTPAVCRCGKSR